MDAVIRTEKIEQKHDREKYGLGVSSNSSSGIQ
jgi:hypothetical protein